LLVDLICGRGNRLHQQNGFRLGFLSQGLNRDRRTMLTDVSDNGRNEEIDASVRDGRPTFLPNLRLSSTTDVLPTLAVRRNDLDAAADRFAGWAPALAILFPELESSAGVIESPLVPLPSASSFFEA